MHTWLFHPMNGGIVVIGWRAFSKVLSSVFAYVGVVQVLTYKKLTVYFPISLSKCLLGIFRHQDCILGTIYGCLD